MADDISFDDLVNILTNGQTQRVWSLLVSLFGDLAQVGEDAISTLVLNQIMGAIGLKPEAVRVALHRLRKDGWVQSNRQGRFSLYTLTPRGRHETIAASPRIYDKLIPCPDAWLIIHPSGVETGRGIAITANIEISTEPASETNAFSKKISRSDQLPAWITEKLVPPRLAEQAADAAERFGKLSHALASSAPLGTVEYAVLRVLVVHVWRRVALLIPDLPVHLFPDDWQGRTAQDGAHALLRQLPVPDLSDFEAP
jgi:phenylacetic acid degradation operon negative regulatory protein